MLPTFSSSSLGSQRRSKHTSSGNFHRNRPPVTRSNSFLGTIKSFVTAPFSWLASNSDDFAEDKDDLGKRRRVAGGERTNTIANDEATREGFVDVDEGITRGTKRLRVSSPLRQDHQPDRLHAGYNDPPANVFSTNAYVPPNRSASVALPSTTIRPSADNMGRRYARSPMRASSLALQPSISVDSYMSHQPQPLQRDVSMSGLPSPRDTSMEPRPFAFSQGQMRTTAPPTSRDLSLPPTSSRPPFVLRSSMTPQSTPQPLPMVSASGFRRDVSEPPPISSLRQHPVFVRGPPKVEGHHRPSDSVTLGTLVENHRSSQSPSRSHSLLFASQPQDLTTSFSNNVSSQAQLTPAQKALHALDIYKTPLVPTRLRASTPSHGPFDINSLINGTMTGSGPDLFKKRNHPILMNDKERGRKRKDRDSSRKDKKGKGKEVNETKPYAGAGGMKKLLARARAEAVDEAGESLENSKEDMEVDKKKEKVEGEVQTDDKIVPPVPKDDWYSIASRSNTTSAPSLGSSLRVGRSKTSRNHIARPSIPTRRAKFSAVYEDDAMEGDDDVKETSVETVTNPEEQQRQRELEELEEASKRVPVFKPPPSFSFAKDGPAPVEVDSNPQEPPITSLPFSFSKPATVDKAAAPVVPPPVSGLSFSFGAVPKAEIPPPATEGFSFKPPETPAASALATETKAEPVGRSIPNFFATSSLISKPVTPPVVPTLSFPPTPPAQEAPVDRADAKPPFSLASGFSFSKPEAEVEDIKPSVPDTPAPTEDAGKNPFLTDGANAKLESVSTNSTITSTASNGPLGTTALVPALTSSPFSFSKPAEPSTGPKPPSMFSFGPPKEKTELSSAPPLFGSSTPFAPSNTGSESTTTKPSPFPVPSSNAPKPLFGSNTTSTGPVSPFSFGPPVDPKPAAPAPAPVTFPFPSAPSTPTAEEKKPTFSFGPNPPAAPIASAFSFVTASAGSDVSSKPFSFSNITRPTTPPKPTDESEMRMEESPTREPTQQTRDLPKPTLNFSFSSGSTSASSALFSGVSTASPFSFGPSTASNPFSAKPADPAPKPAETPKPAFSFTPATNNNATPFSFSTSNTNDASRPNSAGPFSFSNTPTSTSSSTPFSFAPPSVVAPATNPFAPTGPSAPSSPSTFGQAPTFTFGLGAGGQAPTPTSPSAPFSFGTSQPASPATGVSTLPATSGFAAASPFGPPSSTPLFTMGPAAPNPSPSGARQFKKLPNRRGGKR